MHLDLPDTSSQTTTEDPATDYLRLLYTTVMGSFAVEGFKIPEQGRVLRQRLYLVWVAS